MSEETKLNIPNSSRWSTLCSLGVLINGFYLLYLGLLHTRSHHLSHIGSFGNEIYPIFGITLVYLSFLLSKKKKTAWIATVTVYLCYLIYMIYEHLIKHYIGNDIVETRSIINIILPILVLICLFITKDEFVVKSDVANFRFSLKVSAIVLLSTLIFGTTGYLLMDNSDFHQEISFSGAVHQTIDQFDLTVNRPYIPYTRRARDFNDTLSIISTLAVVYCIYSLFQPLKFKFFDPYNRRYLAINILTKGHGDSEDYFKIWPHDKNYFFNDDKTACIAYSVHKGVALAISDPFGAVKLIPSVLDEFLAYCSINDWLPSFIHTRPYYSSLYRKKGFSLQKIGEEAVVDCDNFLTKVTGNKYFRNVINRFEKQAYKTDVLLPPHNKTLLKKLRYISDEWLTLPNKAERGYMIGFFDETYLNSSTIIVLKDHAGEIIAFINKLPSFNTDTASYDLIRHTKQAPSNSIDFLLINFIKYTNSIGFKSVNLGLSPLAGVGDLKGENLVLNKTLSFIYANSTRFYSFQGLYKFKQKYEPKWDDRFIAYQRGFPGFIRTMTALNTASKMTKK
ncbi:MAG TPA: phosphatidylglycerol lysyltransferase domain-containing protein [Candidatus Saccharimonadales bacterium]|jgi:phosphatidylglycerol lysyltransferase|nr:phosphatidylglycerol lysyltransferase domain-containing protein [Candidatus Saccharimonadales bacterium]